MIGKFWSNEEIELLKESYCVMSNEEVMKLFSDRTLKSVCMKAKSLNLMKTKKVRSALIGKRNKMIGRDLCFENVKEIALKYKTKGEFQQKDGSAYSAIKNHGWQDILCSHMIPQSYSIPQLILNSIIEQLLEKTLYNDRKTIKPYELDVYIPKYKIAFEYDGKHWHKNNYVDKNKLCSDLGIRLFVLVENNRKYEEDVKQQLSKILNDINSHCKTNISQDQLNGVIIDYKKLIIDKRDIAEICSKYTSYTLFKKEYPNIYSKLLRYNLIEEYTSHMIRSHKIWNIEELKNIISKYEYVGDLLKENFNIYGYCKRNYPELLKDLKYRYKTGVVYNINFLKIIISKYEYIWDFRILDGTFFRYCKKHHPELLKDLKYKNPKGSKYSIDFLKNIISKYENVWDFRTKDNKFFWYCKDYYPELLKDFKRKNIKGSKYDINFLKDIVSKYEYMIDIRTKDNKFYVYCKDYYPELLKDLKKSKRSII